MNTCVALGSDFLSVVLYSHFIPVVVALLLGVFVLVKSNFSFLSKIFFSFVLFFCLWLVGDVVLWGALPDYHLVTYIWSLMDYFNIIFYLLALYFFLVLIKGTDIAHWQKIALFGLSLPAWWVTTSGRSVTDFYQPFCEATNNSFLTEYKLWLEVGVLAVIMVSGTVAFFGKEYRQKRKQIVVVGLALALFLSIFASTEYISSVTGIYEINLYSLFVLPVFLAMIIFSITNLRIFAYRSFGMQLLIYILLVMVGSQFFFLHDATYRLLTTVTFVLSVFLGVLLVRNIRREEELALALQEANEGQANLLHIINHQIKGYMTKARLVFDDLLNDASYGLTDKAKPMIQTGFESVTEGVNFVQDFLNASNIERGTYAYNMTPLDFKSIVSEQLDSQKDAIAHKGLKLEVHMDEGNFSTVGDKAQLGQAVRNLIDNSVKYTPAGNVKVQLTMTNVQKILLKIQDTGVGLSDEVKPKLFTKGGRDKDSQKININSTGFGLAFVRGVAEAHKGRVWAESAGVGKGSSFYMELPQV